ncbi:MAG TPA: acyl-CoA desaturase [Thermomicrobiales bacterium]|nr:acyl-CoA desaturase [Thermomicrobiales bacterium]
MSGQHDYRELTGRLRAAGLLERQPRYYGVMMAVSAGLLAVSLALFALFREPWAVALNAVFLSAVTVQLAFLVHDAGHRQMFAHRWQNALVGLVVGDLLLGVSYGWWVQKHNRHHAHPNHVDLDPDIDLPMIAFSPEQAAEKRGLARLITKYQIYCAVPLLSLVVYGQHLSSVRFLGAERSRYRWWEVAAFVGHLALYIGLPLAVLGPWSTLLLIGVHQACTGIYLGLVFAPNHKGMALADDAAPLDPVRAQVLTARNVRPNPLVDWCYGGLNYQIEHHLFPSLPRNRLRAAQGVIREFCRERGIAYHETSVLGSYREIARYLRAVSASLPVRRPDQARQPTP